MPHRHRAIYHRHQASMAGLRVRPDRRRGNVLPSISGFRVASRLHPDHLVRVHRDRLRLVCIPLHRLPLLHIVRGDT